MLASIGYRYFQQGEARDCEIIVYTGLLDLAGPRVTACTESTPTQQPRHCINRTDTETGGCLMLGYEICGLIYCTYSVPPLVVTMALCCTPPHSALPPENCSLVNLSELKINHYSFYCTLLFKLFPNVNNGIISHKNNIHSSLLWCFKNTMEHYAEQMSPKCWNVRFISASWVSEK